MATTDATNARERFSRLGIFIFSLESEMVVLRAFCSTNNASEESLCDCSLLSGAKIIVGSRPYAGGVKDSSRWSADRRIRFQKNPHAGGVQASLRRAESVGILLTDLSLRPLQGRIPQAILIRGYRALRSTPGYYLAALRAEVLIAKAETP